MKLAILTLAAIGLSTFNFAQTPNYFDNNPGWSGQRYVGPDLDDTGGLGWTDDFLFYMDLSVEIGAYTYYSIKERIYRWPATADGPEDYAPVPSDYELLVRQEGRAVYAFLGGVDSLFISYDLEIGDELGGHFGALNPGKIVHTIDSVLVGDTYRRRFYTDSDEDPFPNSHIMEGIGHFGGEYPGYYFGSTQYGEYWTLSFFNTLECYGENHISLWPAEGGGSDCFLTLDVNENSLINPNETHVFPNPFLNNLTIESDQEIEQLTVFSVTGEMVRSEAVNSNYQIIDLSTVESGYYLLKIDYANGSSSTKSLVKN